MAALESLDGKLSLYVSTEFYILYKFYKGEIKYKGISFADLDDKGIVDDFEFTIMKVKPSQAKMFNINIFENKD